MVGSLLLCIDNIYIYIVTTPATNGCIFLRGQAGSAGTVAASTVSFLVAIAVLLVAATSLMRTSNGGQAGSTVRG